MVDFTELLKPLYKIYKKCTCQNINQYILYIILSLKVNLNLN